MKNTLDYLEIALKTSQKADEDRESLKNLIPTEKLNYDLIHSELFVIARENMLRARTSIAARLETKRAEFTKTDLCNSAQTATLCHSGGSRNPVNSITSGYRFSPV